MIWFSPKPTPDRRQIDPIECGAVCLAIILEFYGRYIDGARLREQVRVSRNGCDVLSVINAAKYYGLFGHTKKLLASQVVDFGAPSILFFDQCHFVVLEGVRLEKYFINDPARGRYVLNRESFRKRFSNIVVTFSKSDDFIVDDPKNVIGAIKSRRINPQANMLILGIMAGIFFVLLSACLSVLLSAELSNRQAYYPYFATGFIALFGLLSLTAYGYWRSITHAARRLWEHELADLKKVFVDIPASFFDERPFVTFSNAFLSFSRRAFASVKIDWSQPYWLGILIVVLAEISLIAWPLAILLVIFIALHFFLRQWEKSFVQKTNEIDLDYRERLALEHTITQNDTMRAMGQEEWLIENLLKLQLMSTGPFSHTSFYRSVFTSRLWLIAAWWLVAIFFVLHMWQHGSLPQEKIYELVLLTLALITCSKYLARQDALKVDDSKSLRAEILFARPNVQVLPHVDHQILIKLSDVSFYYPQSDNPLWHHLNLSINKNEIIGVVGQPRAGVSTLFRLIAGQLSVAAGEITFFSSTRVALINDDARVFHGTLKDNVSLFDHRLSDQAIADALLKADAQDLFYARPLGLLTLINRDGKNLSMSEKKRLLLAQSIAQNPDVFVLDDVFAALDDNASRKVLSHLRSMNAAVLLNSYAARDLAQCDRVIFIDSSHQLIISNHDELFATNAHYRDLIV